MPKLRIGISRCLLGEKVRYDGAHKLDSLLVSTLSPHVEWVPVCPEVEAGLGVPRESMRLKQVGNQVRVIGNQSETDFTSKLLNSTNKRIKDLADLNLTGYIFKKNSPSCGLYRVKVYQEKGPPTRQGQGVFAQAFVDQFPLLPVEEEGRLNDTSIREHFIVRLFTYWRWQCFLEENPKAKNLVEFHSQHKYLILAHHPQKYRLLGQIVAKVKATGIKGTLQKYEKEFLAAFATPSSIQKNCNVLQHMAGFLKNNLESDQKRELHQTIQDYYKGLVPLLAPITLIKFLARLYKVEYLLSQIYLNPHPKELTLRNHA